MKLRERFTPQIEVAERFVKEWEWTWTTAVLFSVGFTFAIVISMGVIPSFWMYFANSKLKWDGAASHKILFVNVPGIWLTELRDAVAMGLSTGPFLTFLVLAAVMQNWRRKLRGAGGETRPAGGYR